jgi:hypothetical protein
MPKTIKNDLRTRHGVLRLQRIDHLIPVISESVAEEQYGVRALDIHATAAGEGTRGLAGEIGRGGRFEFIFLSRRRDCPPDMLSPLSSFAQNSSTAGSGFDSSQS